MSMFCDISSLDETLIIVMIKDFNVQDCELNQI